MLPPQVDDLFISWAEDDIYNGIFQHFETTVNERKRAERNQDEGRGENYILTNEGRCLGSACQHRAMITSS